MSKYNVKTVKSASGRGPITTEETPSGIAHEGAPGYTRDLKSELFLLAVANMVAENTFYERGDERDSRYASLIRQVAVADPGWIADFLGWLRREGNMRSAPLVGAIEAARAMVTAGIPGSRGIVNSVLQRADEPGEAIAYWTSHYGRRIPKPIKRGIADAAAQLYNQYSLLKYDTSHAVRFGDVVELTHPSPSSAMQAALFRYAIDRRHNRAHEVYADLLMIQRNTVMRATAEPEDWLRTDRLHDAGMTWENALSAVGSKVDKAKLWEALIPSMGYMALLRNLRNFDEAGVSNAVAETVSARLCDPQEVAKSRQFPFRFYAAFQAVKSLRWGWALEKALELSLANVPALSGRTLVLVDQSPSMFPGYYFSTRQVNKDISNADLAKLFGCAVALRATKATLVGYGNTSYEVAIPRGGSVLKLMEKFHPVDGTDTFGAAASHFNKHDRVVIVTDEQNQPGRYSSINDVVPHDVPVYVWNIGGYRLGATAAGATNRHTFGGMTDAAFRMVPLLESGRDGRWPWEV